MLVRFRGGPKHGVEQDMRFVPDFCFVPVAKPVSLSSDGLVVQEGFVRARYRYINDRYVYEGLEQDGEA